MALQFLHEVPNDLFFDFKQIGSGSYSTIFSAMHIQTNTKVALKISVKNNDDEYMNLLYQELNIQKKLNHPFICRYFTNLETEHLIIIVLELIEGINLLDYVNNNRGLKLNEAQNIFSQLIIAVEYLHNECNITHRDLKLENIMLDNYGHIRLIDFGFSSQKKLMSTICGSVPYCAPEVLECQEYTKEADVWSLGIILYCILSGHLPFFHQNISKLASIICTNDPTYPPTIDPLSRDLISRILIKNPSMRITIEEIKGHAFISHVDFFQIDYKQLFTPVKMSNETHTKNVNQCIVSFQEDAFNCSNLNNQTDQFISNIHPNPTRRFSQISDVSRICPVSKNISRIKFSNSNPSIGKERLGSNCALLARPRRKFVLSVNVTMSSAQISNLQRMILIDSENVNDIIISRKDFSTNLNKLIEASILTNVHESDCLHTQTNHIKLRSSLPIHFQASNIMHKNIQNRVLLTQNPVIAKPI